MAWAICREGDAEPEYFRGTLFGPFLEFTRNVDEAFQYLRRAAAAQAVADHFPNRQPEIRIVPIYVARSE